jgi:hypothetical protein
VVAGSRVTAFENPFDLHAVDAHVAAAEGQPAVRVHRAEPGMGKLFLPDQDLGKKGRFHSITKKGGLLPSRL